MPAIFVKDLVKRYKNGLQALNGVTFTVEEGEVFSLLGPNGAGKSTIINILTTYLKATSGNVTICGKDISNEAEEIRLEISCVAQRTSIDPHLSLKENLIFQSKLYKVPKVVSKNRMEMLISCLGLEKYFKYPVSSYSGGIKRRLDIALSLMSGPKILFLDEPTVGMDIESKRTMWDMVKKIKNDFKTTVFLTTHYLEEAEQLSDTICIIKNGKEIIQGSPNELRKYMKKEMLKISFSTRKNAEKSFSLLKDIIELKESDMQGNKIITNLKNGYGDLEKTINCLIENHILFLGVEIVQPTLEDVFINLTCENREEVN